MSRQSVFPNGGDRVPNCPEIHELAEREHNLRELMAAIGVVAQHFNLNPGYYNNTVRELRDLHTMISAHTDLHSLVSSAGDRYLDANGCPDLFAIPDEEIGPTFQAAYAARQLPEAASENPAA